jgi:hypothetical protein
MMIVGEGLMIDVVEGPADVQLKALPVQEKVTAMISGEGKETG